MQQIFIKYIHTVILSSKNLKHKLQSCNQSFFSKLSFVISPIATVIPPNEVIRHLSRETLTIYPFTPDSIPDVISTIS